ncbi:uncharacterized protein LOC132039827 isoform X2 [Lycium ferocissimum]|uniref:uncharacterized protein LOC132039827 isoform X2 n=1 Tax=Lycium ferocissimum TaxID=112874 RepID=UPI002816305F|nr:uncharacterized protein LOC132039827 isoform X2 [Lycium ferocissimum]
MDFDDWELSAEELDNLERDALKQIAERNASSSSATTSNAFRVTHKREDALSAAPTMGPSSGVDKVSGKNSCGNSGPHDGNHVKQLTEKRYVKFFLHATGNIAAKFSYDQILVEAFRKIPRASWSAKERLWMFPLSSLSVAEKVLREISGSNLELENLDPLVQRAIAAASAMPDLRDHYEYIPNSIESKLLPFQREGVRFALQHGGRVLLADEMGLGKTIQAIAVVSCIRESWPVLVLAPSALRLHWASMIQQWMGIPSSEILVVLSQCGGSNKGGFKIVPSNTKKSIQLDGVFNIVSYDTVPKLQDLLMASSFKVVIADESHFLKNAQAKRTTASLPLLQKAQYVILLSGTPALSRPIELFKQLEALHPTVYKNVHEYGNRYCKGGIFGVYQGASNHEELHSLIKATVMIRRLKKDVLSELPQKRRQQVFLNLGEKEMRQVNALFRELEIVKGKSKSAQSEEEANSFKFAEKSLISKIYTVSGEAKIPAVLDYLGTMVEANCKFLIFAHHQSMIDSIHEYLLKKKVGCIRIDGSTPSALRQALVTDFQEKETIKAAVLSIRAGGVGLTLTAASTVIFAELSWTPGDLIQAEDRAHRIGQVSSVNVCYLLANDTVDDIIWDVVQSKLDNLGQVLDGQEKSLDVSSNQSHSSPAKQKTLDSFLSNPSHSSPAKQKTMDSFLSNQSHSSPAKQKTLDSFIKRCNNSPPHEPSKKHCRH